MMRRWRASIDAGQWLRRIKVGLPLPRVEREWSWARQALLEQVAAAARLTVTCLLALAMLLGWARSTPYGWLAWAALLAYVFADALFRRRHADRPPRYRAGSAFADLALYLAVLLATGGQQSPFQWLLPFGLVWQAHRLEPRSSLPITAAYVAAFLLVHRAGRSDLFDAGVMLVLGTFLALGSARRAELHRKNLRDGLTGCFSRAFGLLALRQLVVDRAYPFSLLFLDLDQFKRVNDTLGHEVGDRVLTQAARAISAAVRGTDVVVRHGGDEFLVLLAGTDMEIARELADRVRERLCQSPVPLPMSRGDLHLTCSCGVVEARPGQDVNQLLTVADQRLYQAKQRRDCIVDGVLGA